MSVMIESHSSIAVLDDKPNTRPLNSFFAFRAYYTSMFSVIQQKERSGLLTQLWKAPDPFQAKWVLIAKAYSVIRSLQGKKLSNVREFLKVTAPFMNIIEPENYLAQLGYILYAPDDDRGYEIFQASEPTYDKSLIGTGNSVLDIVMNAIECGYVKANEQEIIDKAAAESMLSAHGVSASAFAANTKREKPDFELLMSMIPEPTQSEREEVLREIFGGTPEFMPDHDSRGSEGATNYLIQGTFPFNIEFDPTIVQHCFNPYEGSRFNAYNIEDEISF